MLQVLKEGLDPTLGGRGFQVEHDRPE
jgi:hypothetical protein